MNSYLECRTCLENINDTHHTVSLETKIIDQKNVLQAIEEFASIEVSDNDHLPKQICRVCFNSLETSIIFRKRIISSDEELKKRLLSTLPDPLFISCGKRSIRSRSDTGTYSVNVSESPSLNYLKKYDHENCDKDFKLEKLDRIDDEEQELLQNKTDVPLKIEVKEDSEVNVQPLETQDSYSDHNGFGISNDSSDIDEKPQNKSSTKKIGITRKVRKKRREFKKSIKALSDTSDDSDSDIPLGELKKELELENKSHSNGKKRVKKDKLDTPRLCPICGKLFKARQNFNSHMTTVHRKKPTKPEKISCLCPDCGRVISGTRQNFVAHRRYHHSDKAQVKKRYSCDVCPKKFYREKNLIIHLRIHKGEKGYVCELCPDKAYTQIGGLILHKRKVHLKKPTCTCNYCGKQFYEKHYLETHIRQWHTGERPFSCEICGKSFSCNGTLLRHRKDSHGEKKPCPKCGKMYTEGELRKHLKRHKIREEGIKRKKYTCEYCGTEMNFTSRKRHLLKQHGIMLRGRGETAEKVPINQIDAM